MAKDSDQLREAVALLLGLLTSVIVSNDLDTNISIERGVQEALDMLRDLEESMD